VTWRREPDPGQHETLDTELEVRNGYERVVRRCRHCSGIVEATAFVKRQPEVSRRREIVDDVRQVRWWGLRRWKR